ncbi:uncharacterized protein TNCV_561051 [Trichonephila clavipes]|uniref:Uncharacterized protein n=1 Tax=Trichonephila clavipes TaxID=2585209 RepID=A0A8X6VEI4_TRICX|nr:uncharacterized protein TNCV_561051 [Trichonephila clavipes]
MHNATVQQPLTTESPNSNPTIVMLQAEVGFVSKHNIVPFRYPSSPFIAPLTAQTPMVSSQGLNLSFYDSLCGCAMRTIHLSSWVMVQRDGCDRPHWSVVSSCIQS